VLASQGIPANHPNPEWAALVQEGIPKQWIYYKIMREMHWSWDQLMSTPIAVLQWLLTCIKIDHQAALAALPPVPNVKKKPRGA